MLVECLLVFTPVSDYFLYSLSDVGLYKSFTPHWCLNNICFCCRCWQIVRDVVEGLACMHGKGLAHADLKTGNILVDEKGRAKLADFGNVKKVLTYTRSICLTILFKNLRVPISSFTYR